MRSAREALTASSRAPLLSALGVITIAFSLFAFGLFGLVAINIRKALDQVEERVEVRAFLSDSTDIESVAAAMKDVGEFPEVNRVDYVSDRKSTRLNSSHTVISYAVFCLKKKKKKKNKKISKIKDQNI